MILKIVIIILCSLILGLTVFFEPFELEHAYLNLVIIISSAVVLIFTCLLVLFKKNKTGRWRFRA